MATRTTHLTKNKNKARNQSFPPARKNPTQRSRRRKRRTRNSANPKTHKRLKTHTPAERLRLSPKPEPPHGGGKLQEQPKRNRKKEATRAGRRTNEQWSTRAKQTQTQYRTEIRTEKSQGKRRKQGTWGWFLRQALRSSARRPRAIPPDMAAAAAAPALRPRASELSSPPSLCVSACKCSPPLCALLHPNTDQSSSPLPRFRARRCSPGVDYGGCGFRVSASASASALSSLF